MSKITPEEEEIKALKRQLRGLEIVLRQNADLESEVTRLCNELDEATKGVLKRGYLHKWRDREIAFASKWGLRYFMLQGKTLSYFLDDKDHRPRRTIDLSRCIVRDEEKKKGGQYHVFSVYLLSETDNGGSSGQLMMKLSSESEAEAKQWIDMLEQACAISDQDFQQFTSAPSPIPINEYENNTNNDKSKKNMEGEIVGVENDWTIDENRMDDADGSLDMVDNDINNPQLTKMMKRVQSSSLILKKSMSRQTFARKVLSQRSPTDFSSSGQRLSQLDTGTGSKTTNHRQQHANAPGSPKKGFTARTSFPASKPMHVRNHHSPLSTDVRPSEQNYRGFFNLGVIILVLSNFRFISDNLTKYGFLIKFPAWQSSEANVLSQTTYQWASPKPVQAALSWVASVLTVFFIEKLAARGMLSDNTVLILQFIIGTINVVVPCVWVWVSQAHPAACMIYLLQAVVLWMKMISYAHANRDLRRLSKSQKLAERGSHSSANLLSSSHSTDHFDNNAKPGISNIFAECSDLEPPYLTYPMNVTVPNLFYFCVAPTLCYQLNYPRSPRIRWRYVATVLLRMFVVAGLIIFAVEQYIRPTLENSIDAMKSMNVLEVFERVLKLSIPNTYVWVLGFYFFFHLWLNLLAELTRFGDRLFYKDWWNARTIEIYWRTWNMCVHQWCVRHIFHPMIRLGASRTAATFAVFLFSAALHEIIISTPFRFYAMHAFVGMIAQAPLIYISKQIDKIFDNAFIGNAIFWSAFCLVGQPMGIIMSYYDLWKVAQTQALT